MESYFQVKARLFLELPRPDKAMAVNADDPWGRRLLELCPTALSFGLQKGALNKRHLWGELLSAGTDGCHMRMHLEGSKWELRSPLVGAFNASNLLAVQAVALEMGIEPDAFKSLESFTGVSGRLERVENPQGLNVFVDYAHTPDALENVLQALRGAGFKRVVTVFGCGGNRDRTKRPLMGEAVARWSDVAVLTSDNPRFEEPEAILKMLCQSYIRDTIGLYGVDDIITTGKAEIQGVIRDKISTRLEQEDIGLVLVNIALQDAEPPTLEVQQAFKAVETSKQEAETAINNANKYANEQLPAAKANADEILQQAEAYKESRIAEAEGQASRFTELYAEYSKYPEITRQRLFYEMIAKVFPDMKIVITGRDGSTLQTVLPLESFTGTGTTTTTGEEP